jgi:hypothetical protein
LEILQYSVERLDWKIQGRNRREGKESKQVRKRVKGSERKIRGD